MSETIHQMQINFTPLEDRLLFRLNTTGKNEFQFWFTRRYVKLLWTTLQKLLAGTKAAGTHPDPQARKAMLSFRHEKLLAQADFSKQYQQENRSQMPLGRQPVLLSKIQVKPGGAGSQVLCLHPETGKGLEIAMNETLLHSFCKLLSDGLRKTDWDLNYKIADFQQPVNKMRIN